MATNTKGGGGAALSVKRGYVDTQIGQIHYRTEASGSGTPLVLFHQSASSSAMYEGLMAELTGERPQYALDTPGYGLSDFPPPQPAIGDYVRTQLQALDALGVREFHAFGFHTGASIACEAAVMAPERVRSLSMCGPPYTDAEQRKQWLAKVEGAQEQRPDFQAVGVSAMQIRADGSHLLPIWQRNVNLGPDAPPAIIHRETIDNLRAGERYQDAIVAVFSQDMPSLLAEVRCPILLLCGDRDVLYPYLQPACADRPDAKCVTLDGGSYVIDQDPARVAAELRSFLQSIDGA